MNTPTPAQALGDAVLLPCPWCGSSSFYFDGCEKYGCVTCLKCLCEGPMSDESKEAAIAAWNQRQHGQHFAGLVEDRDSWRRVAARLATEKQAAEARCAELRAKYEEAVAKYSGAADRCHLLLDAKEHWHNRAVAAERERNDAMAILRAIDHAGCLGAGMKASIAAFLGARG